MSVTVRLFIFTSLASLGLAACSGGDGSDAPAEEESNTSQPSMPVTIPGRNPGAGTPAAPTPMGEGTPAVTGIEPGTAPDEASDGPSGNDDEQAAAETGAAVPSSEHCEEVGDWDPEWVAFEEEVLARVNEVRSLPADCGVEGEFAAAPPLTMNPILRCSARLHSLDMFERNYFEHDTPDGVDPFERMAEAGFVGSGGGENIALGQPTPLVVMEDWMASDGHCANIMRAAFDTIGVGYFPGSGQRGSSNNYWTQNFGAPAFMRGGGTRR